MFESALMLIDSSATVVDSRVEVASFINLESNPACRQGLCIQVIVLLCSCAKAAT